MKTAILQIEPYDDLASIRDKALWCKSERILLVLPRQKRNFPNRLELNLIKRWANENGASLAIVSRNDITREYAQSLAIPVFRSIPEAERGEWTTDTSSHKPRTGLIRGFKAILEMREGLPVVASAGFPRPILRLASMVISIIALISLIIFLVPSATVIIYPEPEWQKISLEIRAGREFSQVNIIGLLPAYDEQVSVSGEKTLISSGTVLVGTEKAVGEVTIKNLTLDELLIPKGSIVATGGEQSLRFITLADVLLPAGGEGVTVMVESLSPGFEGNIEAGQIKVLEGSNGPKVEVENRSSFVGGVSANVNSPTDNDYTRARTLLLQELEFKAKEAAKTISGGKSPIIETIKFNELVIEEQSNPIGKPADTLTLNMTVTYHLLAYEPAHLQSLVDEVLELSLPQGYHYAGHGVNIRNQGNVIINADGQAVWQIEASRQIVRNLPIDGLLSSIKGLKKAEAIRVLNEEVPHLKSAEVISFIKGWPWLPLLASRMRLEERFLNER